ncbi:hypothetical protein [Novipirellula galeiformis]|uniref:hypothetical protein n=1 Tax=Novipirellula galeiformis TaxID=2528004 RepID=UPI0011B7FDF6|nr:hypothetical protein [Novipirellula galeiformis]
MADIITRCSATIIKPNDAKQMRAMPNTHVIVPDTLSGRNDMTFVAFQSDNVWDHVVAANDQPLQ